MPRHNNRPIHIPYRLIDFCDQKRRFKNEREALEAAEYQMLIKPQLELHVYKCERCGSWHLTRQSKTA